MGLLVVVGSHAISPLYGDRRSCDVSSGVAIPGYNGLSTRVRLNFKMRRNQRLSLQFLNKKLDKAINVSIVALC